MDDVMLEGRLVTLEIGQKNMQGQLEAIITNHLPHLHTCLDTVETKITKLKEDISWVKGRQKIVITIILGVFVALGGIYYFLIEHMSGG